MRPVKTLPISAVMATLAIFLLTACDSDNDDDGFNGRQASLLIANDQGSDQGVIERYRSDLTQGNGLNGPERVFDAGLAEGIDKDAARNYYQAGISGTGTVRAICNLPARDISDQFETATDRSLTAALTGPKGIAVAQQAGLVMVAENGAANDAVSLFSLTAADAATPLLSIPRSVLGDTGAWDVAYDEGSDRLFVALINGDIAYFANYLANATNGPGTILNPALTPTAVFRPDNALAASNMHGIAYMSGDDRLIVSDVADPMVADDGSVYVFESASTLTGAVTPDVTLRGPSTLLGNPVDLQVIDGDLVVAEKANAGGQILVFADIANSASGDLAPDSQFTLAAPESLVATSRFSFIEPDISDLSGQGLTRLFVSSNAGGAGTDIIAVPVDLTATGNTFTGVQAAGQFVESLTLDANGDALVSFDDGAVAGGLSVISRPGGRADGDILDLARDRQISGAASTLVAPKGIEVVGEAGLVLVADLNAEAPGAIKAFSLCATGNAAPALTTTLPAGVRPWDLDYDPVADRLYVAATNGTVLVYDDYLDSAPGSPDRVIDPDDQSGFADSNIHGIVHDADTDRLILTDVGDPGDAGDGRIYVIDNASTADGITSLRLELAGANTALGNPVDIAFDGSRLFVAEKSNNQLQRIDDLYSLSGLLNLAPDIILNFTAPESIALSPDNLP